MTLEKIVSWLNDTLELDKFDDVSNNGIQIARSGSDVRKVAFAVDGSLASVKKAVEADAQLLVVHHGISWGGGMKAITGGTYNVVKAAIDGNLALYAAHLPLDASKKCGNNWEIARKLGLRRVTKAFNYHGNVIGVIGFDSQGRKIGVCSGGAASFAPEAKELGCDEFITGEADWGETIAAENVGMKMTLGGHYETETYGVKALMREMKRELRVNCVFIDR
jgi:putative NIF3 family GTP cyclohydrolase 1 type 2